MSLLKETWRCFAHGAIRQPYEQTENTSSYESRARVRAFPERTASAQQAPLAPDLRALLDHVSADSLRGHLSFIASDALEGRNTPSRGLDIAAEYIAAQFRRAGLEPAGDDGYFQTANFLIAE